MVIYAVKVYDSNSVWLNSKIKFKIKLMWFFKLKKIVGAYIYSKNLDNEAIAKK